MTREVAAQADVNGGDPGVSPTRRRSIWDFEGLWTGDQLAKVLGVKKSWIYAQSRIWVESNGARGIPTVVLGRYYRYRPPRIAQWLEEREQAP